MLNLLVDIGNTRVKWTRHDPGRPGSAPRAVEVCPYPAFREDPGRVVAGLEPGDRVWFCATAEDGPALLERALGGRGVELIRGAAHCPLRVDYGPGLGDDRLLAADEAVYRLGNPCVVIGCGSAVTVDLVGGGEEPLLLGGAILAGERLILRTLGGLGTLPRVEATEPPRPPGTTTEDCLRLGAHRQCTAAVADLIAEYAALLGTGLSGMPLLLHGGDAERYRGYFPEAVCEEFVVLFALARRAAVGTKPV